MMHGRLQLTRSDASVVTCELHVIAVQAIIYPGSWKAPVTGCRLDFVARYWNMNERIVLGCEICDSKQCV
jgi:hypothetical protein